MTWSEVLTRYAAGERCFTGLNLDSEPYGDLSESMLAGADFSNPYVVASFRHAKLRGANFQNTNLKTSDFTGADLTECEFRNAALCACKFAGAVMTKAKFAGAYIHSHTFSDGELPT